MKLAPVLVKYLTAHKQLNLPGLGIFHLNSDFDPEADYSKKDASVLNITFEQAKITGLDEALIDFVSTETGKMKILSESDLRSQIDGALDFLNTGKPYFIQGIGTLTRKPDGSLEFFKEKYQQPEKKKEVPITAKNLVPQAYIDKPPRFKKANTAVIIFTLSLLAIAAVVWFYLKNSESGNAAVEDVTAESATDTNIPVTDSNTVTQQTAAPDTTATRSGFYKYVLEVAQQPRASKRYNQLKKISWPVELETSDSVSYTLFIQMPAAADTTKIKDSLSALSGNKVWIEK